MNSIEHNFTNHPPKNDEVASDLDEVTALMIATATQLDEIVSGSSREKSLMMTNLEQASMWAKAAIARNQ